MDSSINLTKQEIDLLPTYPYIPKNKLKPQGRNQNNTQPAHHSTALLPTLDGSTDIIRLNYTKKVGIDGEIVEEWEEKTIIPPPNHSASTPSLNVLSSAFNERKDGTRSKIERNMHFQRYSRESRDNTQRGNAGSLAASSNQNSFECLVCQQEYKENDRIRQLPCFHNFHSKCIDPWIMENGSCAECRFDIKNYVHSEMIKPVINMKNTTTR